MIVLQTVAVAFAMFSAVPMPRFEWTARNMRYMLCALPMVGGAIGLLCWAWQGVCTALAFPDILRGAGLCLIPAALTGGIHLDGYTDTCDALASRAQPQRMQEILKDPHIGAFAAIRLCMYFLACFALWTALPRFSPVCIMGLFCLSRSLAGFAVAALPLAKDTGLAHTFAAAADRERVRLILAVISAALAVTMLFCGGWLAAVAAALIFLWFRRICRVRFGGLSGDLSGWFVQTAELAMLAALVLTPYVAAWWHTL